MQSSTENSRDLPSQDPVNPTTSRSLEDTARSSPLPSRPTSSASTRTPKSLNKRNFRGETQLLVFARKGDVSQCSLLIGEGADVNLGDNAGWTPLHEACARGHFAVAELLIRNAADVNAKSADGVCPLHDAIHVKDPKLVWLLLANGADPNMPSAEGPLPVDMEEARAVKEISILLQAKPVPDSYPFEEFKQAVSVKESSPSVKTEQSDMERAQSSSLAGGKDASDDDEKEVDDSRSGTATPTSTARTPIHTFTLKRSRGQKTIVQASSRPSPSPSARPTFAQRTEDVYEFRGSPESEGDTPGPPHAKLNITFGGGGGEKVSPTQASFYPPAPKRLRADENPAASSTLEAENSDSSVDDEADDASTVAADSLEQVAPTRKVPPLRISLTKTPSEEDGNAGELDEIDSQADDASVHRGGKGRRPCPGRKGHHHEKDSTQRVTRSRLRQTGAQIDDVSRPGAKKKGGHHRRGSATSTLTTSLAGNAEKAPSASPAPEGAEDDASRSSAGGDSEGGAGQQISATLALFSKNNFDSYREMRGMIESKWVEGYSAQTKQQSTITLPAEVLQKLKHFAILRRNTSDDAPETMIHVGKTWPQSLQALAVQHAESRDSLQARQRVERDRLLQFAEREFLRQTRVTVQPQRLISAVRMIRDSEIYNPLVLDDPPPTQPAPLSRSQLRQRLTNMATTMKNRHTMEAQSLLAQQRSEWSQAVKKADEAGIRADRRQWDANENVRIVPVEEVKFAFLR